MPSQIENSVPTHPSGYRYKDDFFDFVDRSSGRSAKEFVPRVQPDLDIASVLDVGCGRGVWLSAWKSQGVTDIQGVDGDYVDIQRLHIAKEQFKASDISAPFSLGRKFDLVECLEVAEHVPANKSDVLLDNLVRHGDLVLFSAATPGQGGEHHVNEQPLRYWVSRFESRGYCAFDFVRQRVVDVLDIEPWYRYNTLVFANSEGERRLSAPARQQKVTSESNLMKSVPAVWKLRCAALRVLPDSVIDTLAKAKHRLLR